MNDVLVFGGGYKGDKRATRFNEGESIRLASHPVQSAGDPVYQPIEYEFVTHRFYDRRDGKEYLLAIRDEQPSTEQILEAIMRQKPKPLE